MAIKPRPYLVQLSNLSEWIKIDDTSFLLFTALMVIYSSTRRKKEARHGSPHKTVWSLRWAAKPVEINAVHPSQSVLGQNTEPLLLCADPFSETACEYECQRNTKWNKFMIKLCTQDNWKRLWVKIYDSRLSHSHLSLENVLDQDSESPAVH